MAWESLTAWIIADRLAVMRRFTVAVAAWLGLAATTLAGCSSASHAPSAGAAAPSPSTSGATSTPSDSPTATANDTATDTAAFTALQSRYHAQLGLYALDTGSGRTVAFQADQRFAFCSTIKALAAAELLHRESDAQLDQTVTYSAADLVDYSPSPRST